MTQVWNNEIREDGFRTEYINGKFNLITVERTRGGVEDRERVYTDNSGRNAYMKTIIALRDVSHDKEVKKLRDAGKEEDANRKAKEIISEGEYIRLTERSLHTQITSLELMSLFPAVIGYSGTTEVAQAIFNLDGDIEINSHGETMTKELFRDRGLKFFDGLDHDTAKVWTGNWLEEISTLPVDKSVARVLLLNMATKASREETYKAVVA